jgi:hypothetical protein
MKSIIIGLLVLFIVFSSIGTLFYINKDAFFSAAAPHIKIINRSRGQSHPDVINRQATAYPPPHTHVSFSTNADSFTLDDRTRMISWIVIAIFTLAWMASLFFLAYRRYNVLLTESLNDAHKEPGVWKIFSDIFYPRIHSTSVVTFIDENGMMQTVVQSAISPSDMTERYALLALAIGFTFGFISFLSTLCSQAGFATAAASGVKSAVFSAVGQMIVVFIIAYI